MAKRTPSSSNGKVDMAVMQTDIAYMREDLAAIKVALQENYVTKDQFAPVKRIAYGAVSLLSLIVIAAIGALGSLGGRKP